MSENDPGPIPAEVLAEIDTAWKRAEALAAAGRRLDLSTDPATGRLTARIHGPGGELEHLPLSRLVGADAPIRGAHRAA